MKKIRALLFLGLIAVVSGTANRAQQTAASPNWADTSAWIQQNITAAARFSYSWASTANNDKDAVYTSFTFGPTAPCHLTLIAHEQHTNKAHQQTPANPSYDIVLSASTANSIQAVPFDLLGWASPMVIDPSNGDTITSPSSSYWEIKGLVYMWQGNPPAPATFDDGAGDPILFTDPSLAQRVATALNHAVDLCGGKPAPKQLF